MARSLCEVAGYSAACLEEGGGKKEEEEEEGKVEAKEQNTKQQNGVKCEEMNRENCV